MKSNHYIWVFSIIISFVCLTSCVPSKVSLTEQEKISKASTISGDEEKSKQDESVLPKPANSVKNAENKASKTKSDSKADTESANSTNDTEIADLAKKLRNSRLDVLDNSTVICTVNGDPITIGDYRHQFKTEQEQVQASLAMNPQVSAKLIQMAQEQGVSLSLEEKKHLADSANKMQAGGAKGFNKMLAENKMTKTQFRDQVFDIGLAFKMGGKLIEEGLLKELINRKLLSQEAKENGYSKEAFNKYTEVSKSPQYKRLLQVSGISADDLKDEIITNELCVRQIDKIKKESPITETEISNYYEKNRGKFRHGPRIRLSQIFIAMTNDPSQTLASERIKLKKENPKLSESDLNKQISDMQKKKAQLAQDLLQRAQKGEDFAALANQYSEDSAKGQKNGGDVGFQEESKIDKFLVDKVNKVPVNGVAPEVVVSPYGFHIFKVSAKESKGFYKLSEIKSDLKDLLAQEKGQQVLEQWLNHADQLAKISIAPEMKGLIASNKLQKRVQ